jgi:hypothetical protein
MKALHLSYIIFYPISSIWSSFGLIKNKCFFIGNMNIEDIELKKIIDLEYIIL